MSQLPSSRQAQILNWLQDVHTLTVEALAEQLQVSVMTVHRDLNVLERTGQVEKVHGGVTLAGRNPRTSNISTPTCQLCDVPVQGRTNFLIQTADGEQHYACCPHCGFLMLTEDVTSALARDFIYGRMVNVRQAVYLLECDISLCCLPSVLCFASLDDAKRFQQGFNGRIADFETTRQFLADHH